MYTQMGLIRMQINYDGINIVVSDFHMSNVSEGHYVNYRVTGNNVFHPR